MPCSRSPGGGGWYPSMPCGGVPGPRGVPALGGGGGDPPPADGHCEGRYASYWNAF